MGIWAEETSTIWESLLKDLGVIGVLIGVLVGLVRWVLPRILEVYRETLQTYQQEQKYEREQCQEQFRGILSLMASNHTELLNRFDRHHEFAVNAVHQLKTKDEVNAKAEKTIVSLISDLMQQKHRAGRRGSSTASDTKPGGI